MRAPAKPLLLGEALHGGGTGTALLGRCGRRLARLLSMTEAEYARTFRRRNLLKTWPGKSPSGKGDRWARVEARAAAARCRPSGVVVLLGSRVAAAFGVQDNPPLTWFRMGRATCAILPHPSGVNRWWNDPRNVAAAAQLLKAAVAAGKIGQGALTIAPHRRVS